MKLQFEYLLLENFKSFRGEHRLDLLDFGAGLHFIRGKNQDEPRLGSNGAGKSSLFDAMCWCLYGQTPDGLHNPDVRPWTGEKPTRVGLQIRLDNGLHEVVRTATPNRLLFNDEIINQEQLNHELRLALPVFTHTVLMGQGQPLFFDLSPRAKMDLFSDVLALDRWEERASVATTRTEQLNNDIEYAIGQLAGMAAQQDELEELLQRAEVNAEVWGGERLKVIKESVSKLEALEKELAATEDNRLTAKRDADSAGTELKALKQEHTALERKRAVFVQNYNLLVLELDHEEMKVATLKKELAALEGKAVCPTCGQPIQRGDLSKHKAELRRKINAINPAPIEHKVEKLKTVVAEMEAAQNKSLDVQQRFQEKIDKAQEKLEYLGPRAAELKAEKAVLVEAIQERREQHNPYQQQARDLRKRLNAAKEKQKETKDSVATLERRLERTKFWVKGFKDVRLFLIEETLEELALASNAMLPEVGLEGWEIQYAIERETKSGKMTRGLNVSILSPNNREPVRWEAWSGGESQRLRLVGALALGEVLLAQAGVEPTLEILDEPTHHLSGEGIRDLCEYLAVRGLNLRKTILLVDHHAIESRAFSSTLLVEKGKNGSRLVNGGLIS